LRAALGLLEKLTLTPDEVNPEDIAELRAARITAQSITDAVYICAGFNIINRIADALSFKVPPTDVFVRGAKILLRFGYKMMSGVWFEGKASQYTYPEESKSTMGREALDDPYQSKFKRLKETVLSGPGALDPAVRKAASQGEAIPGVLGAYVKKVATRAYMVTDEDVAALCEAGYTEDQIFEATVSAAMGAGLVRVQLGIGALRAGEI
jgi:alkylhydroperoxidase family enzyme